MNKRFELEANLPSQASSPAPDKRQEGEQQGADRGEHPTQVFLRGEQDEGEQAGKDGNWHPHPDGGSGDRNGGEHLSDKGGSSDEKAGEQSPQLMTSDEYTEDKSALINDEDGVGGDPSGKWESSDERPGEHPAQFAASSQYFKDEQRGSSDDDTEESVIETDSDELADEQVSQWLKAILPEMTNGWWDVYPKGRGFAVKFCWRDQERQTLSFPRISEEQYQTLKRSAPQEAGKIAYEQISAHLHNLSLNPAKREKALIVARKLGINLDET